jgi:phosphoribosyl 1,2-cyclic phosphodiesterase
LRHGDLPPLILDCGTGARKLGYKLVGERNRELNLAFTHFHMDHVFGFPFFAPIYTPGYKIRVTVPAFSKQEAKEKLARYLNGLYHPTRLRDLPAELEFHSIRTGRSFDAGGFTVHAISLNHPGGSLGYRVEADGQSICYMTDTAPFASPGDGVTAGKPAPPSEQRIIDFLRGADVVIYDTMYTRQEYLEKMTWGHSFPEYANALCRAAGVAHLILFHHLPVATDDDLDELEKSWASARDPFVTLAREGGVFGSKEGWMDPEG